MNGTYILNQERFSGLFHVPDTFTVTLIGAGGIGALAAVMFGKMGVQQLAIIDNDAVSDVNIATQFHRWKDIGQPKVDAVGDLVWEFSGCAAQVTEGTVDQKYDLGYNNLVISAVDSIKARHEIFGAVLKNRPGFYIDARMSAMEFQMYVVNMNDGDAVREYMQQLFFVTDDDVPDVACTMKATFFTSAFSAGYLGEALRRIVTGSVNSYRLVHNIPNNFLAELTLGG
jgi:molybdopterin/thiamine biosynthesis adenylyltransferase